MSAASTPEASASGGHSTELEVEGEEQKRWLTYFGLPALVAAIFVGLTFGTGQLWYLGIAMGAVVADIGVMIWLSLTSDTNRNSADQ